MGYTPDVLTDATAELTLDLLLATNRRLLEANKEMYNGGWKSWAPNWMCGQRLKDSRVGLFGFGRIGQEIASRLVPFKPCLITYTARTERVEEAKQVGAKYVSFDEMLQESDFIIVCCALTPATKEIFNSSAFGKMKKNCIFINTAHPEKHPSGKLVKLKRLVCMYICIYSSSFIQKMMPSPTLSFEMEPSEYKRNQCNNQWMNRWNRPNNRTLRSNRCYPV